MGGRALKRIYTERKTTEQFNVIAAKLLPILSKELGAELHLTKSFHDKETHGDMDILIKIDNKFHLSKINLREFVKQAFSPNEIFVNGGVVSFDYDEFQIDLIPVRESNWETAKCYFDYDPSGNIIGKVANSIRFRQDNIKARLSYGVNGLTAVVYSKDTDKKLGEVLLSKKNYDIFTFLGYDYYRYVQGFNNKQEIFDFCSNTRYFQRHRFLMENLSHKDRKRNRKRPTYHEFLEYMDTIPERKPVALTPEDWFEYIIPYWSEVDLGPKIEKMKEREIIIKQISEKFNGHIVMHAFPELEGNELGQTMGAFKHQFEDWDKYILIHTKHEILEDFTKFYKK